jgi:hypothetical protein
VRSRWLAGCHVLKAVTSSKHSLRSQLCSLDWCLVCLLCVPCRWVSGLNSLPGCKTRLIKALAVDPEGVATLLPRYLAATPLPPALAAAAEQVRSTVQLPQLDGLVTCLSVCQGAAHSWQGQWHG